MDKLDAGLSELRRSFAAHSKAAEIEKKSSSHFLLLFYAVECGMKACILQDSGKLKLSQIDDDFGKEKKKEEGIYTHDLSKLQKKLGSCFFPPTLNPNFHLRRDKDETITITKVHQAWRYGVQIREDDENRIIEWLKEVQKKIRLRIGG